MEYVKAQLGNSGETKSEEPTRYLRLFASPGKNHPQAGLHERKEGIPPDGWASGEPLTTGPDAARALEDAKGDPQEAERSILSIAATRLLCSQPTLAVFVPRNLRAWKVEVHDVVSASYDIVLAVDAESMRESVADMSRRNATDVQTIGSLPAAGNGASDAHGLE